MRTGYDEFVCKTFIQGGSICMVIPYMVCRRLNINWGDKVTLRRPEGARVYRFYKSKTSHSRAHFY